MGGQEKTNGMSVFSETLHTHDLTSQFHTKITKELWLIHFQWLLGNDKFFTSVG